MSARDMREACAKGRDALASLWAAIGDRLCAGKPLDTAYAQRVAEECRAASRALEDVVPADDAVARAREEAVALLADARKCVVLANANGYYDVWLSRCDRVLGGAR